MIDAKSEPLGRDDDRTDAERRAEALAEVCGYVLNHGDVPQCGGARPHLNVLIRLEDLESRARSAMLDCGGTLTPESLRMLACDAAVVPIVMNGAGQPLDIRPTGSSPTDSAGRWPPGTAAAPTPAATEPRPGAKSTIFSPGNSTARTNSMISSCCAACTTG
ncbi:MAG: DUF222 domain-containing protein [Pseudonocardia sp.]|nr:DUF222 domain-containing protein [Pseudonocardia sp.]